MHPPFRTVLLCALLCHLSVAWGQAPLPDPTADAPATSFPYTPGHDPLALDRSVDPCVDFYRFSCGGWMDRNPIPADESSWSVYAKLAQDNQRFLWGVLTDLARPMQAAK